MGSRISACLSMHLSTLTPPRAIVDQDRRRRTLTASEPAQQSGFTSSLRCYIKNKCNPIQKTSWTLTQSQVALPQSQRARARI